MEGEDRTVYIVEGVKKFYQIIQKFKIHSHFERIKHSSPLWRDFFLVTVNKPKSGKLIIENISGSKAYGCEIHVYIIK